MAFLAGVGGGGGCCKIRIHVVEIKTACRCQIREKCVTLKSCCESPVNGYSSKRYIIADTNVCVLSN